MIKPPSRRPKRDSTFLVHEWMPRELKLKGNEILVFAIIFSFTRTGSKFTGSLRYLKRLTGLSKSTLMRMLKSLCQKKLAVKTEVPYGYCKARHYCHYMASMEIVERH
ncbi:MAG: helix-turn-helix domain-containing protein [Treponema sp.]|nr:helix-turn-helix domain-containing protein [Treponema sp.]